MLQKTGIKLFSKFSAIRMMTSVIVTNYVNFFEKLWEKCLKQVFSNINLEAIRKKIFKIFFQVLKVKITYKLNIYRLIYRSNRYMGQIWTTPTWTF